MVLSSQSLGFTGGVVCAGLLLPGFLSLSGMVIKNAIVLIAEFNLNLSHKKSPCTAVVGAGVSRVRPVSNAALTTVMGMTPLLLNPFHSAMAVTIMVGLSFATVLTLVVVPLFYVLLFRIASPTKEAVWLTISMVRNPCRS